MGYAILIKDVNFSANNIGTITFIDSTNFSVATKGYNFLDTGINPANITKVIARVIPFHNSSQESFIVGGCFGNTSLNSFQINISSAKFYCLTPYKRTDKNSGEFYISDTAMATENNIFNIEYLKLTHYLVNGINTTLTNNNTGYDMTGTTSLYLFNSNVGNQPHEHKDGLLGIINIQFYNNNTLLKNFKSAVYNGIPCFFETVERNYYYILGSDEIWYGIPSDLKRYQ